MITQEKLKLFVHYRGDLDMWSRTGKEHERNFMASSDWHLIDLLLQDANVIARGLGSKERTELAWERLRQNCESEQVIEEIFRVSESGI
ncbi:MAG: hypothetical protein KF831_01780 [Acidobacteria bacterium]|nr:hypothetical protein [Acidobacteriota bacterium]